MEVLTKSEAQYRSACISDINYELRLFLTAEPVFHGELTVQFHYKAAAPQVKTTKSVFDGFKAMMGGKQEGSEGGMWLDGRGISVIEYKFESKPEECEGKVKVEQGRVKLLGLVDGFYRVWIRYSNTASDTKSGLIRYEDPCDSQVYFYTHMEPYGANHLCPCFDQPDLKAQLKMEVLAPREWKVIGNAQVRSEEGREGEVTEFEPTPRISTYLWAVCAGPFLTFTSPCPRLPTDLHLYCRQSIAHKFPAKRIFKWTIQGLNYLLDYLGREYEFGKYDQVFVPGLDAGAMENVGCVIYNDSSIHSSPSVFQNLNLCNTILHEMVHIWFGNLVTLTWWDDLWLNESFATYLSAKAQFAIQPKRRELLLHTFLTYKEIAYDCEQVPGAKAVRREVDTADCKGAFDMITYVKGSSVLEQLEFSIGEERFREVLQTWIAQYQYSNVTVKEFCRLLESFPLPIDPQDWLRSWIESPGLSTLQAQVQSSNGLITSLIILQTCPPSTPLRPHVLMVSLFDRDWKEYEVRRVKVEARESTIIEEMAGLPEPSFVLVNSREQGHCIVKVDERQLTRIPLQLIVSSEARHSLLRIFIQSVRSYALSALEYLRSITILLPSEPQMGILYYLCLTAYVLLLAFTRPGNYRKQAASRLFQALLTRLKTEKDRKSAVWIQSELMRFLIHPMDVMQAVEWLETALLPNIPLREKDRAEIVRKYAAVSVKALEVAKREVEMELVGKKKYLVEYCRAAVPVPFQKDLTYDQIPLLVGSHPSKEIKAIMSGFSQANQPWLYPYGYRYLTSLPLLVKPPLRSIAEDYLTHMAPLYLPVDVVLGKIKAVMWVVKTVCSRRLAERCEEAVYRLEMCVAGRNKSEEYLVTGA